MALSVFVLVLLVCSFMLVDYNKAEGVVKLSREEELKLDKELKLLNKPAVKTIKTEYGDLYDCVDFYKQPAFDHPLLKNHTFHPMMRPTSRPKWVTNGRNLKSNINAQPSKMELKGGGCPKGTVPIRRTTREDLIGAKLFSQTLATQNINKAGIHRALVRSKPDPSVKYHGIEGRFSVHSLPVKPSQYTSGQMKIQKGRDSIQVGWTVNPIFYNDNRTRLFTRWTADQTGCLNTQCPGFVIQTTEIPLDYAFQHLSKRGGPIYTVELVVYRDKITGVWWLEVSESNVQIGYWPQRIFSPDGLAGPGNRVEWGGELYSPPGEPGPAMGTGFKPITNTNFDAYAANIGVANDNAQFAMPRKDLTETFIDNKEFYNVNNVGDTRGNLQYLVLYGGPAGITSPSPP